MTPKPSFGLPHGASGIEFGDFVIEFLSDKIVALAKNRPEHYTLHAGLSSGILGIHRTWRDEEGNEHHQTVFAMRRADLPAFLDDLVPMTRGAFRLLRRLRPGWLYRHGIWIVRGLDPITDQEMAAITRRQSGRKRITLDGEKLQANIDIPEYFDEIWEFPDGAFSLFDGARRIGIGIKATDRAGCGRLFWFKPGDVVKFFNAFEDRFLASALKYAIPPEKYSDYAIFQL